MTFSCSVHIDAPVARVFAFFANPAKRSEVASAAATIHDVRLNHRLRGRHIGRGFPLFPPELGKRIGNCLDLGGR